MARKKRKRIASRGSVNNIILRTLVNGDKYGYEIIKEVEQYSNGKIILKQPSLYSSLTRFEEKKYVSSYWGDSDIGGRRHYYHLTDEGLQYYKKFVLKESYDNENTVSEIEIDDEQDETFLPSNVNESQVVDENLEINNINDNSDTEMSISEVCEDDIPALAQFESTKKEDVIIPDHYFHTTTPIETMVNNDNNQNNNINSQSLVHDLVETKEISPQEKSIEITSHTINNEKIGNRNIDFKEIVYSLRDTSKNSYKKYIENNNRKLYMRKPKKIQKIILDSDGIYKLRDEDYVPPQRHPEIIIDNVIKRSNHSGDIYGYASYSANANENKRNNQNGEITEEEKRKKTENFIAKFDLLTMSKMKPVSTPVQKSEPIREKKPEPQIDYRGKLNAIIERNVQVDDEDKILEENNLFNYVNEEKWLDNTTSSPQIINPTTQSNIVNSLEKDDPEDVFINLDEEETFDSKETNNEYIEEINTYTAPPTQVNMTRYDNITQAVLVDKTYLLNNKFKMVFGIIMSLIMIAEVTSLLFIFKNLELYNVNDKALFILAYVLIGIFALAYIFPYFVNSNNHKQNNFKLKYSMWFGILTFLVGSILIYCINALSGFEIDNFDYFAVKLILPIVLVFNFIISPLVYSLLLKNKSFYD